MPRRTGAITALYPMPVVKESPCFCINIPSEAMPRKGDSAGIVSGKRIVTSQVFESYTGGEVTKAPPIKDCPVGMECRPVNTLDLPTHEVFTAEILATYADENVLTDDRIDIAKLKPLPFDMSSRTYWSWGPAVGDCRDMGKKMGGD